MRVETAESVEQSAGGDEQMSVLTAESDEQRVCWLLETVKGTQR